LNTINEESNTFRDALNGIYSFFFGTDMTTIPSR
jgi:hypothetical protein